MTDKIIITTKNGSVVSAPLRKLKSPRAVLVFTLEALLKYGNRREIIQMIKDNGTRIGLELNAYDIQRVQEDK